MMCMPAGSAVCRLEPPALCSVKDGLGKEQQQQHGCTSTKIAEAPQERAASHGPRTAVVLTLNKEMISSYCRRGPQRRFQEIQQNYNVTVNLDRKRGVLSITGDEAGHAIVRRQLICMSGKTRAVSAALWMELMRVRTLASGRQALMAQIQEESGCRVHIERTRKEVRLFGDVAAIAEADRMLKELAEQCVEEAVELKDASSLSTEVLEDFAVALEVSLCLEDDRIKVCGLREAVAKAMPQMEAMVQDSSGQVPIVQPPLRADLDETAPLAKSGTTTTSREGDHMSGGSTPRLRLEGSGMVLGTRPPGSPSGSGQVGGPDQRVCTSCGREYLFGAGVNFCTKCGAPVPREMCHSPQGLAQMTQQAHVSFQPMMQTYMVPLGMMPQSSQWMGAGLYCVADGWTTAG